MTQYYQAGKVKASTCFCSSTSFSSTSLRYCCYVNETFSLGYLVASVTQDTGFIRCSVQTYMSEIREIMYVGQFKWDWILDVSKEIDVKAASFHVWEV